MALRAFRFPRLRWRWALVCAALPWLAFWMPAVERGTGEPLSPDPRQALTAFLQGWTAQLARADERFFPLSAASAVLVEPLAYPAHTYRVCLRPAPASPSADRVSDAAPVYAIVKQDDEAPFAVAVLEYGVGTRLPFDASSAPQPTLPGTAATVYGGLESFWRAGQTLSDPVTGERLPVPARFTPPEAPGYRLAVLEAARHEKRPVGDPLATVVASRKPGARPDAKAFDPRRPLPWTGYAASLYGDAVSAFYTVDGFHRWDGGTVFVALRDPWAEELVRFLPLPELNRLGGFYPGGAADRPLRPARPYAVGPTAAANSGSSYGWATQPDGSMNSRTATTHRSSVRVKKCGVRSGTEMTSPASSSQSK